MFTPTFSITNNLLTYIAKIESAKAVIDNAALVPAWEAKFRDDATERMVHYGTKIEGNDLTFEQAQRVVRTNEPDTDGVMKATGLVARERDIQEVINYRNVLTWMDGLRKLDLSKVYTNETLQHIHQLTVTNLVDEQYAGAFRDKQVIVKSATANDVVFRPPVSMEIPYLIEDFFNWATSDAITSIHPVFISAITHYQLVYIHPFIEGNGRTARAMAALALYAQEYDFKRFFSLEKYFDSDVEAYYQALLSVQQSSNADMTYWLEYFCYGVAIEIDKIQEQVLKLSKDIKMRRQLGKQVALSERQIIILELFQNLDTVTSEDMQKVLPHVSVDTILRDVKDLISKEVLKKMGVTKGVKYSLVD